jgi:hypothetical protein
MRKKIVGIFVSMLLIATIAIPISAINKEYEHNPISTGADVPIWEVGDSWTYNMELYIAASQNVTDDMVADVSGELIYEVVEDSGDTYKLTGKMRPFKGIVDLPGNIDMKVTRLSSYSSNLEIQKTDLSLINHYYSMKGIVLLTLGPIPLPIPIQIHHSRMSEFNPVFNITPFPLNDGDSGVFADSLVTEETETSMFWGLIPYIQKEVEWRTGDVEYNCTFESITVPAGTYDVYNVTGDLFYEEDGHDMYRSYYAEEIGNVVKSITQIEFLNTGETYYYMELELKSTTYEP